ncbi:MAG TPA: SGNH/GDSL hydrolase family protein [Isosphaeraceae bacterium]|nr:SGNH/GDSL hydrolase family protein [Isosphaeraceae bacterium]
MAAYLLIEIVATMLAWVCWWDSSMWLFEDSGRTWHFDAVRGYRLTQTPSRFARITNGNTEFLGTARGNVQGFPDRHDFSRKRQVPGVPRVAVFGDSFTEAQYLRLNWPARVEDLAREQGAPVRMLNFGVSGGGLANWWSTLTKIVAAEEYEIDGVIFAVYPGDLRRRFSMWEHRDVKHPLFGRVPSWDPRTYPITLTEARRYLKEHPAYILTPAEFERTIKGHWPRQVPRRLRPFFLTQAWRFVYNLARPHADLVDEVPAGSSPDHVRLVSDIRQFLAEHHLPALVVEIPDRASLLNPSRAPAWPGQEARAFADAIGARLLDVTPEFAALSPGQIRAQFLPYDGHWSQAGSDRFAAFVVQHLDAFRAGAKAAEASQERVPQAAGKTDSS